MSLDSSGESDLEAEAHSAAAECAFGLLVAAADGTRLQLETLEGAALRIDVTSAGYVVAAGLHEGRTYESLPSLLMAVSPGFKQRFHDVLCRKLEAVATAADNPAAP